MKLIKPGAMRLASRDVCIRHPSGDVRLGAPVEQALLVFRKQVAKFDHASAPNASGAASSAGAGDT